MRYLMSETPDEAALVGASSDADAADLRSIAVTFIDEAFVEAQRDGLDTDCVAHAALFAAFRELVATYGEEATAVFAGTLAAKIRAGAYTISTRH